MKFTISLTSEYFTPHTSSVARLPVKYSCICTPMRLGTCTKEHSVVTAGRAIWFPFICSVNLFPVTPFNILVFYLI